MRATIYHLRMLTAGPLPVRALFRLAELFGSFDGRFKDRAYVMEAFERQNETVRRHAPQERLLVFDVRQGLAQLCGFLGVEIPDGRFPLLNETREMRRSLLGLAALAAVRPSDSGIKRPKLGPRLHCTHALCEPCVSHTGIFPSVCGRRTRAELHIQDI
jgi:hypothetical protein